MDAVLISVVLLLLCSPSTARPNGKVEEIREADYTDAIAAEKYSKMKDLKDSELDRLFVLFMISFIQEEYARRMKNPEAPAIDDVLYNELFGGGLEIPGLDKLMQVSNVDLIHVIPVSLRGVDNTPHSVMTKCQNLAANFATSSVVSSVAQTVISSIPGGDGVTQGIDYTKQGVGVLSNAVGNIGTTDPNVGRAVGRTIETAGTATGDILIGIFTLGILPAVGAVGKGISSAAMAGASESMYCAACILSAMLHKSRKFSESLDLAFEKRSQLVTDWEVAIGPQHLRKRGAFATKSGTNPHGVCGWDVAPDRIISDELIFQELKKQIIVAEGFRNAFDIIGTPCAGVSRTTRQWLLSTAFQGSVNLVGRALVRFLSDKFWDPMVREHGESNVPVYSALRLRGDIIEAEAERIAKAESILI